LLFDRTAAAQLLLLLQVLYATFASPWADAPSTREPQYQLPMCYYIQPPALKTTHFNKFQLETLFYIFYAMPQDVLQVGNCCVVQSV
jgi:CCR4-NOT transcription complex subunit 2